MPKRLFALALVLLAAGPLASQEKARVHLSVTSEPAEASVVIRYGGPHPEERFLGRTSADGPLELDLDRAGPAELVIFKNGFVCRVETLDLRSGGESRLAVRLTKDVEVPRNLTLKDSPAFVKTAKEFQDIYVTVLFSAVQYYVEEKDPRVLVESSTATMVAILNAVRAREKLLRRELQPEARRRYYGEELDLRAYPELRFTRGELDGDTRTFTLAAGSIAITGTTDSHDFDSYLAMLHQVYSFLRHKWDRRRLLSDAVLARCAIEGLLAELDDEHSHFMTPDDVAKMASETVGSFGGIGIVVSMRSGRLTVIAPMSGSPGERAGILAGDQIAAIDGARTDRLSMREAVGLMRGKIGTAVELTLRRGDRELTVTVVRAKVAIKPTAESMVDDNIGYLRISSFMHGKLSTLVREAIVRLQGLGAKALIIDLRNNPGGLLTEAHKVADLFVKRGVILSTRTRLPNESRKLMANPRSKKFEMPLVVLINGGSASAAEILAGTLKEHGLATLIGERSFGKGSVQRILPIDTYHCALALTVATYHLPSGATPHKKGVVPDVVIKLTEEEAKRVAERTNYAPDEVGSDPQMAEARRRLRAKLSRK